MNITAEARRREGMRVRCVGPGKGDRGARVFSLLNPGERRLPAGPGPELGVSDGDRTRDLQGHNLAL